MLSGLDGLVRRFGRFSIAEKAWNRFKCPGLLVGHGVNIQVAGIFSYGQGCTIGDGTNIVIQKGSELILEDRCYVGRFVDIGPGGRISIGSGTTIQDRCILLGDVAVGRDCLVAPNVILSSGHHHFDLDPTYLIRDQDQRVREDSSLSSLRSRPITIEDDCWLGINSVIMRGVRVAKGAIVGAGSFVATSVQPYAMLSGAAARQVAKRLDFKPSMRIDASNPGDRPYFYSGFEVSEKSLRTYSAEGGIAARAQFVLCLDTLSGGAVHLVVKCIDYPKCEISHGELLRSVDGEFGEVVFDQGLTRAADARIAFQVSPSGATIILKEAWVA